MTWIMFDKKILHPETGAYFHLTVDDRCAVIDYYGVDDVSFHEGFKTLEQAQQRFEELKKMLIKQTEFDVYEALHNEFIKAYKKPKLEGL